VVNSVAQVERVDQAREQKALLVRLLAGSGEGALSVAVPASQRLMVEVPNCAL
jgi:hypothetical protein